MTATQTQLRRGSSSQCEAMTPAEGEMIIDLTNDRPRLGDGFTQGGIIIPNYIDVRNCSFSRGAVGGTANAITITLSPVATSYQVGMTIKFIATANNTGAVTINVDGLGNRNLEKISGSAIVSLSAGDIVSGGFYEIIYDGSQFQMSAGGSIGPNTIGQGDLKTSSGNVNLGVSTSGGNVSAVFGFINEVTSTSPILYARAIRRDAANVVSMPLTGSVLPGGGYGFLPRSYRVGSGASSTLALSQVYVTSSPPFDLGDGEVGGFFFALVDNAGNIVQSYLSDVPPWAYNGPTDIRASHICKITHKKYRMVVKNKSFEEIMDGAPIKHKLEEITHSIKNKDMALLPHPFLEVQKGHKVVLFDPMDDKIRRMIEYQNLGGGAEIMEQITNMKFEVSDSCKRKCPKGVHVHKLKYKYTKKF